MDERLSVQAKKSTCYYYDLDSLQWKERKKERKKTSVGKINVTLFINTGKRFLFRPNDQRWTNWFPICRRIEHSSVSMFVETDWRLDRAAWSSPRLARVSTVFSCFSPLSPLNSPSNARFRSAILDSFASIVRSSRLASSVRSLDRVLVSIAERLLYRYWLIPSLDCCHRDGGEARGTVCSFDLPTANND